MVLHKWRFPFRSWVLVNILAVIRATRDGDLCFQIVNLISCQEGTNTFLCSQRHASWMPYRVKVWINPGSRYLIGKLPVAKLVKKCPDCMEVEDVYNSLLLLLVNTPVVPKVVTIRGLNLPGTPMATSACRWITLLFYVTYPNRMAQVESLGGLAKTPIQMKQGIYWQAGQFSNFQVKLSVSKA